MKNKVIWITGASSGIGKALAIKFANEGWQVAASARRENLLKELSNKYPNIQSFPNSSNASSRSYHLIVACLFGYMFRAPAAGAEFRITGCAN